jgi:hypothetical protein
MYKIAAIIGGVLLMAGVALAGTVSSVGSPNSPTIGQTIPTAGTTVRQEDRAVEHELGDDRGREAEARGRANEAGEDAQGDDVADDRGDDNSGSGSSSSGPSESSGRGGGEDDGGHSGHGHGSDD